MHSKSLSIPESNCMVLHTRLNPKHLAVPRPVESLLQSTGLDTTDSTNLFFFFFILVDTREDNLLLILVANSKEADGFEPPRSPIVFS